MSRRLALTIATAVVGALGCGDGATDERKEDPIAACRTLVTKLCDHRTSCLVSENVIAAADAQLEFDGCYNGWELALQCDAATGVGASYEKCLDDIASTPCAEIASADRTGEVTPVPTECDGVVTGS